MIIDISNIVKSINKEITKEIVIDMTLFESRLGIFPILKKYPVELQIANRENKLLLISGNVKIEVGIPCGRCLEEVPTQICFDINKELRIDTGSLVDEEMEETDYLIGFELDVDKLVYAEILVNWPMKVLCKDDCEGICKVCGTNLNKGACNCQRTELDPRMAAIQDIFNKFKEV
ncbi:MAG: DUF177 domain-containing protein [Lachnospiraceae bacterium]|nr:DUF177 domain-containing protein [Lachnospiraceae bacterium]